MHNRSKGLTAQQMATYNNTKGTKTQSKMLLQLYIDNRDIGLACDLYERHERETSTTHAVASET